MIPPGKRQMVRLVAVHHLPVDKETAYRVLIDELPAPSESKANEMGGNETGMGIRLSVRYAIPLFLYGGNALPYRPGKTVLHSAQGKPVPPAITWQTARSGNGHRLVMRNGGKGHARITAVRWGTAQSAGLKEAGDISINEGLLGYVLPDSQMHWDLEQPPPENPVLRATINGEETLVPRGEE